MESDYSHKYNAFQTKQGNIIWAGAMCIAWQTLQAKFTAQPLAFQASDPKALKTIHNCNNASFSAKDIHEKSYYAKAGYGNQTQTLINKQIKQKFPNFGFQDMNFKLGPRDIISFAYLFKQMIFTHSFERKQKGNMLFNGQSVESFWAETQQQKKQIHVIQFKNMDFFSVELQDESTKDFLFILKIPKILTVDQAIEYVLNVQKRKAQRVSMKKTDYFQMPIIEIDCQHDFKQMIGLRFKNIQLKDYTISVMQQALKLKIDECGTKVENKAVIVAQKTKVLAKQQPRYFILDKTFWIVMKQPKKHPYLCIQVVKTTDK